MNINKSIIVGRITKNPEVKALPSGISVATFSVATNHSYKSATGEKKETTEFHSIVVFGKTAESCGKFLVKGQEVGIEGRIQTRVWEKDGIKIYRTEIIADNVQFGSKPAGEETQSTEDPKQEEPIESPVEDDDPNNIPF